MLPETVLDKTVLKDWVKQLIPIQFRNKIKTSHYRISLKPYNGTDELSKKWINNLEFYNRLFIINYIIFIYYIVAKFFSKFIDFFHF